MTTTVVAIDLGASSGRVMRGTLDRGTLAIEECSRFHNHTIHVPRKHGEDLQWDLLSLWRGIRTGLREAARRGPVDAIGIDTWAVDYGLLDEDDRLVGNPFAYRSSRTDHAVAAVHDALDPAWLYARNGVQFQPFNTIYQVVADRDRVQTSIARTLLLLPDLIAYWLTGRQVCEVTNASTTGLLNPETREWDEEILGELKARFGVAVPDMLPELIEPGETIGTVSLTRADLRTHAGEPTPMVAVGSHDTASAVVAVPATRSDGEQVHGSGTFGFVSSGTWSLVGIELEHPVRSEASFSANFTNELGVDGTVRYLKNIMGMWVQQECLRQWREQHIDGLDWPSLNAATEAAAPLRTLFDINAPDFMAPGEMIDRVDAKVAEIGEQQPRTRGEYLRAITESLVVAYRRALREAQELSGKRIERVHVVGGGSRTSLLFRSTANATGVTVIAGPDEGTAIGNMVVQLRTVGAASGGLDELREIVAASVDTKEYDPVPGATVVWDLAEERLFGERRTSIRA